ncbi:queuosine 5'-phosphate N-glycosylase/hydrolase isoform X2 [Neocloeon triangulifer]|nr:queuosine 5'-phosphate N-glycosylase/hydrolase isoform X2 [Neocloeon triangulifer]
MNEVLTPRDSGEFIASKASHVKIIPDGIQKLASAVEEALEAGSISIRGFAESPVHPKPNDPECLDALLVMDALNFSFWTPDNQPKWTVVYDDVPYTGYFALCAALVRAKKEGVDVWRPEVYSKLTEQQLKEILRSSTTTEVPLIKERCQCLQEVGNVLTTKFSGSFSNLIKQAEESAVNLLNLIVSSFPCFRDEATYKGQKVAIYKRAQILVADVWSCFEGQGQGRLKDIDQITMFADYRVPQMLVYYGCLEYSPQLQEKIAKGVDLPPGSEEEVEIRGCSIAVVDRAYQLLVTSERTHNRMVNPVLIDQWLWTERRRIADAVEHLGYHKTRTIFY